MTTTTRTEPIRVTLDQLGLTADAIADSLRAKGIKGDQHAVEHCPLANLIRGSIGGDCTVEVYGSTAWVALADGVEILDLPDPAAEFVARFDDGVYLDLITPLAVSHAS